MAARARVPGKSSLRHGLNRACAILACLAGGLASAPGEGALAQTGTVLDRVRGAGIVTCGVDHTPGFSGFDDQGREIGFDVDFCRAVAAAVLGDAEAIRTRRVSTATKFQALKAGEIDIAFGMTTWTYSRDTALGTAFPAVTYYDGQGFLAWSEGGPRDMDGLTGSTICVQKGTTSAGNLEDFLKRKGMAATVLALTTSEEKMNAFAQRQCGVVTGDRSELAVQLATRAAQPGAWRLLPGTISREPLGPVVAQGDGQWFAIVRWVVLATVIAEARGVDSASVGKPPADADQELRSLAGTEPGFGRGLGLDDAWARWVVEQVGAYDAIFARSLAPLGLDRGENALWRDGGVLYAPPLR